MLKIHLSSVKGCSFTGYIETADLSPEQVKALGVDLNNLSVEVAGDFGLDGSLDDIQISEINAYAYEGLNDLTLDESNADIDALVEDILATDLYEEMYSNACAAAEYSMDCDGDR